MTNKQKNEFFEQIISVSDLSPETLSNYVLSWIKKNLSPDEVFNRKELLHWLEENKESIENKYPVIDIDNIL